MLKHPDVGLAVTLTVATIVGCAGVFQPYRIVIIHGASMAPTYANESVLWERRPIGPLYDGEVVVTESPDGVIIKRIAYVSGDSIPQLQVGNGWTDLADISVKQRVSSRVHIRYYKLPKGEIYVMGDNRLVSVDSRAFGPLPESDVIGVVSDQRPMAQVIAK